MSLYTSLDRSYWNCDATKYDLLLCDKDRRFLFKLVSYTCPYFKRTKPDGSQKT